MWSRWRSSGVLVISLASVFFALLAIATRSLAGQVPSAQISLMRFVVGLIAVVLWFAGRRRLPNLANWRLLALRGLFGGSAVLSYFFAIERLGAASATVLNYSSPVMASVFAAAFLGERSSAAQRGGLVSASIGAALVATATGHTSTTGFPLAGVVAGLLSAVLGGAALAVMKKVRDDTDAMTVFFAFCAVGGLMSAPWAAYVWVPMSPALLGACAVVGLLGLVGQVLLTWGMGHTTATVGSATTQLVPAIAWTIAIGVLHEPIVPLAAVGAVLCVGGVIAGAIGSAPTADRQQVVADRQ